MKTDLNPLPSNRKMWEKVSVTNTASQARNTNVNYMAWHTDMLMYDDDASALSLQKTSKRHTRHRD
ncbi:MAG: hypothetical protein R2758_15470 [Bacteroidales bacterium]